MVSPMLRRFLTMRGVCYIATRFCGATIRQLAFDEMYKSGKWNFHERRNELTTTVEKYAAKGSILMVGCGTATILECLGQDTYSYLCGLDISAEAISKASKYANDKIKFEVGDIQDYQCDRKFNVILFSESFYYIPRSRQESLLNRLCQSLTPDGCIIVTLSDPDRYADIIKLIEGKFRCIKSGPFVGSKRYMLVFNK